MNTDNLTQSFIALRERLHRSAVTLLKNEEDAIDAMQDTFYKLWRSGKVETEAEAKAKLFTVLRNVCIDNLRKRRSVALEDADVSICISEPHPLEDMDHLEQLITSGLTELQRKIYSLSVHHGLDYCEIADRLGMNEGAVRANMCRVRKKISENYSKIDKK